MNILQLSKLSTSMDIMGHAAWPMANLSEDIPHLCRMAVCNYICSMYFETISPATTILTVNTIIKMDGTFYVTFIQKHKYFKDLPNFLEEFLTN